jgi:hypothetical protein
MSSCSRSHVFSTTAEWVYSFKMPDLCRYIIIGTFEPRYIIDDEPAIITYRCYVEWKESITVGRAQRELNIVGSCDISHRLGTRFEAKDSCMKSGKYVEYGRWAMAGCAAQGAPKTVIKTKSIPQVKEVKVGVNVNGYRSDGKAQCQRILSKGALKGFQCPDIAYYDNNESCLKHAKDKALKCRETKKGFAIGKRQLKVEKKELQVKKALAVQTYKEAKKALETNPARDAEDLKLDSRELQIKKQTAVRHLSAAACQASSAILQLEDVKEKVEEVNRRSFLVKKAQLKKGLTDDELIELERLTEKRGREEAEEKAKADRAFIAQFNRDDNSDSEPEWDDLKPKELLEYYERDIDNNINNLGLRKHYTHILEFMPDDAEFLKHFNTDPDNNMRVKDLKARWDEISTNLKLVSK